MSIRTLTAILAIALFALIPSAATAEELVPSSVVEEFVIADGVTKRINEDGSSSTVYSGIDGSAYFLKKLQGEETALLAKGELSESDQRKLDHTREALRLAERVHFELEQASQNPHTNQKIVYCPGGSWSANAFTFEFSGVIQQNATASFSAGYSGCLAEGSTMAWFDPVLPNDTDPDPERHYSPWASSFSLSSAESGYSIDMVCRRGLAIIHVQNTPVSLWVEDENPANCY